jgi:amino-acid N-acetyltransferase
MTNANDHVEIIREAFRYTQAFRDKTFVLQIDDTVADESRLPELVSDLVVLQRTGIRIVLAAGARARIDEILERYGVDCEKKDGIRISTPEAIPFIRMAAFDAANRIMTSLSGFGVNAVIGNWVRARSLGVVGGVDYQDAGMVDRIQDDLLFGVIDQGSIPILPCIGWSTAGKPYNLSSRELATSLSIALGAKKLFFVSAFEGLRVSDYRSDDTMDSTPDGTISRMSVDQAARFIELNGEREDPGVELVRLGLRAAREGVERVHLVNGRSDGAVLREIFSNFGVGTMIHTNEYQSIRPMQRSDASDVHRLMRPMIEKGLLLPRSENDLIDLHDDFVVFETDGMVHGCAALHFYNDDQAEIAGLVVDPQYDHLGIGQQIVSYLVERARERHITRLFVLTTQASDWFEQLGFRSGKVSETPSRKQSAYDESRNSRILILDL